MFWEVFTQEYLMDEDGNLTYESLYYDVERFTNYNDALRYFINIITSNRNDIARVWIKVYKGAHDNGEIMTAHSLIWGDTLFNENAI